MFPGELTLGDLQGASIKPRLVCHSLDAIRGLGELRAALAERMGPRFVAGPWDACALTDSFAEVEAGLAAALGVAQARAAA